MTNSTGAQLRRYRAEAGMTQQDLAHAARVSKTYISEIENDVGRKPSGEILMRLADALGVTIGDLFGKPVAPAQNKLPSGLEKFAQENGLSQSEKMMLAQIRYRGKQPQSKERWMVIWNAIKMTSDLDKDARPRQRV